MTTNIKAMLLAIAVTGVSACIDGSPGDDAPELLTEHFDPELAAAITPDAASCGRPGNTATSVRVNDAAFTGSARQRTGTSTSCAAPGQLEPSDDVLYYCVTCTSDCSDVGSWTYNKNLRTGVSGWTRNDLLRPEPGGTLNGSSRNCGF